MRLTIASRKSDLARIQAQSVGEALKKKNPNLEINYNFRESLGDKNLNDPLWKMPEKGVFTQDFFEDLISCKVDLVVHSWKDLPVEERAETLIAATLPRGDQRDILLLKKTSWPRVNSSGEVRIFSSSPRRAYNLEEFLSEALPAKIQKFHFEPVRGNVPTRVQKLITSDNIDSLVVAKAALDRLLAASDEEFSMMKSQLKAAIEKCLIMVTPLERNPSAPGQGALAIEVKRDREEILKLLETINCKTTFDEVTTERKCLKEYGGGCHQKVGISVKVREFGEIIYTRALTDRGQKIDRMEFFPKKNIQKTSRDKIFPADPKAQWFKREFFDVEIPQGALWISKDDALPLNSQIPPGSRLVWTSGWETWKKLARRGIWVSGCNEGLGESEENHLGLLYGPLEWIKLGHSEGHQGAMKNLPTYKLVPLETYPEIRGKTHFYWMSGSSFLLAVKVFPHIKEGQHFCGPGNTFEIISQKVPVTIFPKYEQWKEAVLK